MDPVTMAAVVALSVFGSLAVDVGLNTLQDYFHVFYQDAYWETSGRNAQVETRLKDEEREVEQVFQRTTFTAPQQ